MNYFKESEDVMAIKLLHYCFIIQQARVCFMKFIFLNVSAILDVDDTESVDRISEYHNKMPLCIFNKQFMSNLLKTYSGGCAYVPLMSLLTVWVFIPFLQQILMEQREFHNPVMVRVFIIVDGPWSP